MTDKNRDFSQIRVGAVVAFDFPRYDTTPGVFYVVTEKTNYGISYVDDRGNIRHHINNWWKDTGGYIVSQPEEQSVAEQASARTREEQIATLIQAIHKFGPNIKREIKTLLDETEKRGDAAGYARRVAEEGGDFLRYEMCVQDSAFPGEWHECSKEIFEANKDNKSIEFRAIYTAPQPDTQTETIAELMALKSELTRDLVAERAKVATLEAENERLSKLCGALRCGSASLTVAGPGQDGSPGRSRALAATGGE